MPVVTIVLVLLVVGFVMYMLQTAPIPVHPWVRTLILGVMGFFVLIFVLNLLGVPTGIPLRLN